MTGEKKDDERTGINQKEHKKQKRRRKTKELQSRKGFMIHQNIKKEGGGSIERLKDEERRS